MIIHYRENQGVTQDNFSDEFVMIIHSFSKFSFLIMIIQVKNLEHLRIGLKDIQLATDNFSDEFVMKGHIVGCYKAELECFNRELECLDSE